MVVRHKGVVVADLPAKSLTDEAPIYDQPSTEPARGSKPGHGRWIRFPI